MKTIKLFIIIGMLCTTNYIHAYSGGSGTEDNPYLISSNNDWDMLSIAVTSGINYNGKYFLLTQDLQSISSIIGETSTKYFCGNFDGGGHTLTVDINSSGQYVGVFGYVIDGSIKNLGVTGRIVASSANYVGGICAYSRENISNCHNSCNITVSNGIAGGIVGEISRDGGKEISVMNCYNSGNITATATRNSPVGGVIGKFNGGEISNCYNIGNITVTTSTEFVVGGIIGYILNNTNITDCFNKGDISLSSSVSGSGQYATFCEVGGIAGYVNGNSSNVERNISISKCYNAGNVSGNSSGHYIIAGGIVGSAFTQNTTLNILGCHNTGYISAEGEKYVFAGGIYNLRGFSSFNNTYNATDCYNIGNIQAVSKQTAYAGGIGTGGTLPYSYCINKGNISAIAPISTNGSVTAYAGGITSCSNVINNCIAANSTVSGGDYTARIVGCEGSSVSNCYALSSMLVNGVTVSSQSVSSQHGKDTDFGRLILIDNDTVCANTTTTIPLYTTATIRWERSMDMGITWENINCTNFFYTETNPNGGTCLYRALNGDGTYSETRKVVYVGELPEIVEITPSAPVKIAGESITLSVNVTGESYQYQWYKGDAAIAGATQSNYTVAKLRTSDSGSYRCSIANACKSITSENINLTVNKAPQIITFNTIPAKQYGDASFTLDASSNSSLPLTFKSSEPSKLFISGNQVLILSSGTFAITAEQAGDEDYLPASEIKIVTVNKAPLTIIANNAKRNYGEANPPFSLSYQGLKNNEDESVLDQLPSISCPATSTSPAGYYDIVLSGGSDNNYSYNLINGKLEIIQGNSIDETITTDPILSTQYYNLLGNEVKYLQSGSIYIVKEIRQSGKVTTKKVIE
jgi:hypothetical protein